jgi:PKD repeat protein
VKATVKDNGGLAATASTSVTVTAGVFTVSAASPANGSSITGPVHFVATTKSSSPVTAMRIYVDNNSIYLVNAASLDTSVNLAPGPHNIVLQAWNQAGQIAKTPLQISVVNAVPVANLTVTPLSGSSPLTVSASAAASTDSDGSIKTYSLDFGDGTVTYSATASHIYATPGLYTVTAKVTDNNGATASAKSTVTVSPSNGVWIMTPQTGGTYSGGVRVAALAGSANPIVTTRIYADSKIAYNVDGAASVDTWLTLNPGAHSIVVQAWDSAGKVYKSAVTITTK